jgi:Secretion system C-terminal sorting domain
LRNIIKLKCGFAPFSTNEIHGNTYSFDITPNPASHSTSHGLNWKEANTINYSICNLVGQFIVNKVSKQGSGGLQNFNIPLQNLSNGLYFIILQNGKEINT